jgi:nitroreductase
MQVLQKARQVNEMEFCELVRARHSVRAFTARPIEPEKLQAILAAANRAPSAGNLQAYEIYAVRNCAKLKLLARAVVGQDFIAQAQVALVFCAHPARSAVKYGPRGASLYCLQDATIACAYAQLAATALGLGSVWVGAFDDVAVRQAIGVGKDLQPVAILPIGYAGEKPDKTTRRPLNELVHEVGASPTEEPSRTRAPRRDIRGGRTSRPEGEP